MNCCIIMFWVIIAKDLYIFIGARVIFLPVSFILDTQDVMQAGHLQDKDKNTESLRLIWNPCWNQVPRLCLWPWRWPAGASPWLRCPRRWWWTALGVASPPRTPAEIPAAPDPDRTGPHGPAGTSLLLLNSGRKRWFYCFHLFYFLCILSIIQYFILMFLLFFSFCKIKQ